MSFFVLVVSFSAMHLTTVSDFIYDKKHLKENKTKDVKVNKVKFSIYICLILVPFGLLASMVFLSMLVVFFGILTYF